MTLSAHKMYGPKGIGALYVRHIKTIAPCLTGGGQEFGLRSGTENVPSIVGFARAAALAEKNREKESARVLDLKKYFWKEIQNIFPHAQVNGSSNFQKSLPHILNIYFPGKNAEEMLIDLDIRGVAVSSGAACSMRSQKPSHVLLAIGYSETRARQSLRFSFGKYTTVQEIQKTIEIMRALLKMS